MESPDRWPARCLSPARTRENLSNIRSQSSCGKSRPFVQQLHFHDPALAARPQGDHGAGRAYFGALSIKLNSTCSNSQQDQDAAMGNPGSRSSRDGMLPDESTPQHATHHIADIDRSVLAPDRRIPALSCPADWRWKRSGVRLPPGSCPAVRPDRPRRAGRDIASGWMPIPGWKPAAYADRG